MNYPTEARATYVVRFSDCDPYGHLNNSRYLDYFHNARMDHLAEIYHYDMKEYVSSGFGFVVGNQQIFYFRPAVCYEKVIIQTSVIKMDSGRITVEFIMTDEKRQEIKAIMWTEYWGITIQTGQPASMPDRRKEFFSSILNTRVDHEGGILKRYRELKEKFLKPDVQ